MPRLKEIEKRLAAIRAEGLADGITKEQVAALKAEAEALQEERKALLELAEQRKTLVDSIVAGEGMKPVYSFGVPEQRKEMTREERLASPEYREAFLNSLLGRPITEEQRTYITSATTSSGAAIPFPTADILFEKMVKLAPMLSEITLLRIAGNVNFSAESTRDAAALHTQNGTITPAADAIITVSLTGYEFAKVLRVSKTVTTMGINAFEGWLTDMLAEDIARIIEHYIINGNGNSQPQGVAYAHTTWTTTYEISTTASITYDNVQDLIALLPAGYDGNAKFLCNKKFVYGSLAKIVEATTNAPILVKDMESGLRFRLMGFPIVVSDKVADDTMYFGDYKKIVGNLPEEINVARSEESGFLANAVDFRGSAIFDCKVGNSDAFVKFKKN